MASAGRQKDIGADEFSSSLITAQFLTTNDVGPFSGLANQMFVTPASQPVLPGDSAIYTVTFQGATSTNTIALSIVGMGPGMTAGFNPSAITNSGSSTLTVTTRSAHRWAIIR